MDIQNDLSEWATVAGQPEGVPGRITAIKPVDIERAMRLINSIRSRHGAKPVVFDHDLAGLALSHAQAMASNGRVTNSFGPGGGLRSRLAAAGFRGIAAENVGAGHSTVDSLLQDWQRSRGHRNNLVHPKMTHFGIAAVTNPVSRYRAYWTLILFRPASH
jgi:uncharacterized protein YkwD